MTALPQFFVLSLIILFQVLLEVKLFVKLFRVGKLPETNETKRTILLFGDIFSCFLLELHLPKGFHPKLQGHLSHKIYWHRCK